jgi:hypothetical protein
VAYSLVGKRYTDEEYWKKPEDINFPRKAYDITEKKPGKLCESFQEYAVYYIHTLLTCYIKIKNKKNLETLLEFFFLLIPQFNTFMAISLNLTL